MPTSEIAIRFVDPKEYVEFKRKKAPDNHHWSEKFGKNKVDYIYGKRKDKEHVELQSVRIKVSKPDEYSLAEIKNYIKERDLNPIKIEMPKKEMKKGLFETHDFECSAEPTHHDGTEYYCNFESSNIESFEVDYRSNVMKVCFKGDTQYLYAALPPVVVEGFKNSVSKGQYFAQKIKNNYPVKKLQWEETEE